MNKTTITAAVRKACKNIHVNDQSEKVARALEYLGVDKEVAKNYSLSQFDTRSISTSVRRYFCNM